MVERKPSRHLRRDRSASEDPDEPQLVEEPREGESAELDAKLPQDRALGVGRLPRAFREAQEADED